MLRRNALAAVQRDKPAVLRLIERRRDDARVELDVAPQVEAVGDVVGVSQNLRLAGVALGPFPFLLQSSENENEYCMLSTSQRAPG